ncbi:hypothetical protein DFH09DRAFT_1331215 [Mycena vulgaris]|nr:hypothetical protein DFH09DRAFT_1331215 [Mycena vulgaris]
MGWTITSLVEPLVITAIFAIGLFANRRRRPTSRIPSLDAEALLEQGAFPPPRLHGIRIPDTRAFRGRFLSRLLARYPFALEILYWVLTYAPAYLLTRHTATPQRRAVATARAQAHAAQLLALEDALGLVLELRFQRHVLRCHPLVLALLGAVHRAHAAAGAAFLAYAFACVPRTRYAAVRRTLVLAHFLAGALAAIWRCAPPYGMPHRRGFIDVLQLGREGDAYDATVHLRVGAALLMGVSVAVWGRHAGLRALAPLYAGAVGVAGIATADEWVLGCVGGACVVGASLFLNRTLLLLRPLEEWGFWVCRAERPHDRAEDEEEIRMFKVELADS